MRTLVKLALASAFSVGIFGACLGKALYTDHKFNEQFPFRIGLRLIIVIHSIH